MHEKMNRIEKGWGQERIFVSNDKYCGKFLDFTIGRKFSMHFHDKKIETWYVLSGTFKLNILDTADASNESFILRAGDIWTNDRLVPHQLECLSTGTILEVSTPDSVEDNYRVFTGDSQNKK